MIHNLRKILQFIMLSFCLSQISYATDKEEILEKNEEKTNISNKIVKGIEDCLQEIKKYIDFQNDYLSYAHEKCNKSPTNETLLNIINGEETDEDFVYNKNKIIGFRSSIKEDRIQIEKILKGEKSVDYVLSRLLSKRLGQIAVWGEEKKYYNRNQTKISSDRLQNEVDSQVTFYQFFNHLILKLYNLTTPEELTLKTRTYIFLSPTLWPLLQGNTIDLGTPEEALKSNNVNSCDLDLFYRYVDESESMLMSFNHWEKKVKKVSVTPFQRSQWDKTYDKYEKIEELPCPDFLRKKTIIKEPAIFINEVKLPKKKKKKNHPKNKKTLDKNSQFEEESNKEETKLNIDKSEGFESIGGEKQNSNLPPFNSEESTEKNLARDKNLKNSSSEEGLAQQEIKLNDEKSEESESIGGETQKEYSPPFNSKENTGNNLTNAKEITQPRGMRIFHPYASSLSYKTNIKLDELNNTQLSVLESIFSLKGFKKVTYGEFSTLWKAINGKDSINESTKSSHKILLDANKKVVTSTFSHGFGMTYTKKTISYIRNALILIGFKMEKK